MVLDKILSIFPSRVKNQFMEKEFHPLIEPSVCCREALPSRVLILNQVMDALRNPFFNKIGIYGIGGVGKTTLAKEVHRKAVEEKLFDPVVRVAVSQTPDLRRIKGQIAFFLGLKDYVGDALIILDDIWTKLDLRSIGIPFGNGFKRYKILLTSRRKNVLSYEMGTQKDFLLEVLHEDEARSLFEMTVGATRDPELRAISNEVVEKCAGFPLLIIIVATYLKNKKFSAWRHTLKKLSNFENEELHKKVHKVVSSVFESLPSNKVKSFFLICALFGESNIPINHLLTYAMGLGLFRNIIRLQDVRDRLLQMIEKLKIESLLLDGDMNGYVKIHDVVLDVALSIATKEQHAFYGISGHGLREWPTRDCTRIALPYCDIDELPQSLEYLKTELFSLFSEYLSLKIPDLFFEGFRELKVINLTGMILISLPSSLYFLTNLNSLYLHKCELKDVAIIGELKQLEFLSFANSCIVELPKQIEQLSQLKLLDLSNCFLLKVFPANVLSSLSLLEELYMGNSFVRWDVEENISVMELEDLRNLTTLEIEVIDSKKLPNFLFSRGLQRYRICIGHGLYWGEEHGSSRWLKMRLKANNHMEHGLKMLLRGTEALYLYDVGGIENLLYDLDGKDSRLKHLHIQQDDLIQRIFNSTMWGFCHTFPTLETLSLHSLNSLKKICHGQLAIGSFSKLQILKVGLCYKLKKLFSYSSARCLSQLQEMVVECCDNMEAIIGKGSEDEVMEFTQLSSLRLAYLPQLRSVFGGKVTFPNLQIMRVSNMENLEHIWDNQLIVDCDKLRHLMIAPTSVSFQNLTTLHVEHCDKLENLVTPSTAKIMVQLIELRIAYCEMMKEIVANGGDDLEHEIIFNCLKSLELYYLPSLYSFCSGNYVFHFPLLKDVIVENCLRMKIFCGGVLCTPKLREVRHWKYNSNEEYKEQVQYWDGNLNETIASQFFKKMVLQNAFKWYLIEDSSFSKAILANQLQFLNMLKKINVSGCDSVQVVFDLEDVSVKHAHAGLLPKLEELELINLPKLSELWNKDPVRMFNFRKLRLLKVQNCSSLKYVFTQSMISSLIALTEIKVENCKMMEAIIKEEEAKETKEELEETESPKMMEVIRRESKGNKTT